MKTLADAVGTTDSRAAPIKDRRPIYANLIKFAELYTTKIRLGVYTPAAPVVARRPKLEELLGWVESYPLQWRERRPNLKKAGKRRQKRPRS